MLSLIFFPFHIYISMDTIDYTNELNTIKYIAQENGYNPEIIDTILRKGKK